MTLKPFMSAFFLLLYGCHDDKRREAREEFGSGHDGDGASAGLRRQMPVLWTRELVRWLSTRCKRMRGLRRAFPPSAGRRLAGLSRAAVCRAPHRHALARSGCRLCAALLGRIRDLDSLNATAVDRLAAACEGRRRGDAVADGHAWLR